MARKKSAHLTDAELRLMEVLWQRETATVADVVEAVSKEVPLAYSTVLTTMRILEQKGYIRHKKEGRAFIYKAVVPRGKARDTAIAHLLRRFFEGSPEQLMLNLVERKKISPEQLRRLQKRIEEKK
jgi:predicted transcriptional regulator